MSSRRRETSAPPPFGVLSNGSYRVLIGEAGDGHSRWHDLAVTRWREDGAGEPWGLFCFLRDLTGGGPPWSSSLAPASRAPAAVAPVSLAHDSRAPDTLVAAAPAPAALVLPAPALSALESPESWSTSFVGGRACLRRLDPGFETETEIAVCPGEDVELRRIRVTSRLDRSAVVEVTSYAEVVLAPAAADVAHPAFSKLFVQTEILPGRRAIVCARRPRSPGELPPRMFHGMALSGAAAGMGEFSCETDRARFIGRGRTIRDPQAMRASGALSCTDGSVLDPIVAIRGRLKIEPGGTAWVDLCAGVAETREVCLELARKYQDPEAVDRVLGARAPRRPSGARSGAAAQDVAVHAKRPVAQAHSAADVAEVAAPASEVDAGTVAAATDDAAASAPPAPDSAASDRGRDLLFFNGLGGFTRDGSEYVIFLDPERPTPAPWVNVIANPKFGTLVSESGSGYTWSENSHEFRLTPWCNDPVSDRGGEGFHLLDEDTGRAWSPAPLPVRGSGEYVCRHGFGYSVFEHREDGVRSRLCVTVAPDAPVRLAMLALRNDSPRSRRLSAAGYVEWVLGDVSTRPGAGVATCEDHETGAILARNPSSGDFSGRVAFLDAHGAEDRRATCGPDHPHSAIRMAFELAPGEARTLTFVLGAAHDEEEARGLIRRFRESASAERALEETREQWRNILGAVQVETPDPSVDLLANGWLLYQTISCRMWGRTGFYQSGGAFGFRDQVQDAMALVHCRPDLLREHLLACAARQFVEGDVQHWWHPPTGRGVRTHCSDDLLWLPLAACRYVSCTGDSAVLDEPASFLEGAAIGSDEESRYDLPRVSTQSATLYEHCQRAITRALHFGAHGLPLIGTCDWNDGMNRVGAAGRGESVWLGFFLHQVLEQFAALSAARGDDAFACHCRAEAGRLCGALDQHGWDGAWYRRAYFDDGTPLGTASQSECQIDSIAQSWSVLSGAGDPRRASLAMEALDRRLVRRTERLIQLLDPPFDRSSLEPGYIKGYVPGVRENGGQYTHAAVWAAMAFAELGDGARAWELLHLINPIQHSRTPEEAEVYKVEPYVVAADVYGVAPHTGRGGWTWYTGSAGWMYRLIVESLLGLRRDGDVLSFAPCLPPGWTGFKARYRHGAALYRIEVRPGAAPCVRLDGIEQSTGHVSLLDDGREHTVEVRLGPALPRRAVPAGESPAKASQDLAAPTGNFSPHPEI